MRDFNESARRLCFRFLSDAQLWGDGVMVAAPDRLLAWTPNDFDLLPDDEVDADAQRAYIRRWAMLSRLVDSIPNRKTLSPNGERLSRIVGRALEVGQPAMGQTLSAAEDAAQKAARKLLYTASGTELIQDSAKHVRYKQYKDRYYSAEQALRSAGNDPALISDVGTAARYEELAQDVKDARRDWETLGYKQEVELARNTLSTLAIRAPIESWNRWKDSFQSSKLKGLDGFDFFPVQLNPSDGARSGWTKEEISGNLVSPMLLALQGASAFPKHVDTVDETEEDLQKVSFEYTFIKVDRHWLDQGASLLFSRTWRSGELADGSISDGANSPSGHCPAFVVGLILVRNLRRYRTVSTSDQVISTHVPQLEGQATSLQGYGSISGHAKTALVPAFGGGPAAGALSTSVLSKPVGLEVLAWTSNDLEKLQVPFGLSVKHPDPVPAADFAEMMAKLRMMEKREKLVDLFKIKPPAPTPTGTEEVQVTADDQILLAGFLCKLVPRCPDPDPQLVWS